MSGQPYDNYAAYWLMEVAYYFLYSAGRAGAGDLLSQPARNVCLCAAAPAMLAGQPELACRGCIHVLRRRPGHQQLERAAAGDRVSGRGGGAVGHLRVSLASAPLALALSCRLLLLVWANGHGSFVVGLLMLGIWLADEAIGRGAEPFRSARRLALSIDVWPPALTLLASGIACLVNPRGVGVIAYVIRSVRQSGDPQLCARVGAAELCRMVRGIVPHRLAVLCCRAGGLATPAEPVPDHDLCDVRCTCPQNHAERDLVRDRDGAGVG